mmetsp:Transcript_9925/g.13032  ORF Transcript_9925/g.13032 Transcript_9925/m.13032 type:complete len:247 (-) Transcript_9925:288-1028(-)
MEIVQTDVEPLNLTMLFLIPIVIICSSYIVCLGILKIMPRNEMNRTRTTLNDTTNNHQEHLEDDTCPICLENYQWCCVTQCGHRFCTECIISYWKRGGGTLLCPYCRTRVTLLIPEFQINNLNSGSFNNNDPQYIAKHAELDSFNAMHGHLQANSLIEQIYNAPVLLRALLTFYFQDPWTHGYIFLRAFLSLRRILFLIIGFFYILSPFDLIPEAMFGLFGLIDDIMVFLCLLLLFAGVYRGQYHQ